MEHTVVLSELDEKQKYHTVRTVTKYNIKIVERCKIYTPNTQVHDCSLSCLGTGTSIKCGGVKLFLCLFIW